MNVRNWSPILCLALACAPLAACEHGVQQPEPDWPSLVGLYPQPSTIPGQGEQYVLLWLQISRTGQDVARAKGENTVSFGCYAQDIHLPAGPGLQDRPISIKDFPLTAAVLDQARRDFQPILQNLWSTFNRPRPDVVFPAVTPVLDEGDTPSYPSAHAALGTIFAEVIAQYDKDDHSALQSTGNLIGTDRVLGGVHYPSDVTAGQRLGKAFATWWIDSHLELIQTACCEWETGH